MNAHSRRLERALIPALLLAVVVPVMCVAVPASEQQREAARRASVRSQIEAMYEDWGRARVSLDTEVIERILAPGFYVLLDGERMTRAQFIERVTRSRRAGGLIRFDADVMTIQGDEEEWTVVITEKLEYETTDADGKPQKVYSFWVTRDGCRRTGGNWQVTYSEAIGYETWGAGRKPPFPDW